MNGRLGCFQFWDIMNKAAMNVTCEWTYIFLSLGYTPGSGMLGPKEVSV